MSGENSGKGKFASLLLLFQGILLILFVVFVDYGDELLPSESGAKNSSRNVSAAGFQNIHLTTLLGFGLVLTFLKRYSQGSLVHSLLIVGVVIQWATLLQGFFKMKNSKVLLTTERMLSADFAAISVLVSFGAILGKANSLQLLTIALLESFIYSINEGICTVMLFVTDNAKTMFVHVYGAFFGLALARMMYRGRVVRNARFYCASYESGTFALLGTLFLWVYWPSLNAYNSEGVIYNRAILTTYYALAASCVATFAFSVLSSSESRLSMSHIQNSTLAGGIAVGGVAQFFVQPWGAILIGIVGSLVSVIGFRYILVKLEMRFKVYDTRGVLATHGFPGLIGAIACIVATAMANYSTYKSSLYKVFPARAPTENSTAYFDLIQFEPDIPAGLNRSGGEQAAYQVVGLVLSIAFGIFGGLLTGLVVRTSFFDPVDEHDAFNDFNDFEDSFEEMDDIGPEHHVDHDDNHDHGDEDDDDHEHNHHHVDHHDDFQHDHELQSLKGNEENHIRDISQAV
eukprot:gene145-757_t